MRWGHGRRHRLAEGRGALHCSFRPRPSRPLALPLHPPLTLTPGRRRASRSLARAHSPQGMIYPSRVPRVVVCAYSATREHPSLCRGPPRTTSSPGGSRRPLSRHASRTAGKRRLEAAVMPLTCFSPTLRSMASEARCVPTDDASSFRRKTDSTNRASS